MNNPARNDFVVEPKDHCFFCLQKIPPNPASLNEFTEFTSEFNTVNSLQYLTRLLKMDLKNVFIEKGDIPPHLLTKVESSRLKASLCDECALINETFSKLCRRLEQIKMEVLSSLELIYGKILKAEEGTQSSIEFRKPEYSVECSEYDLIGKRGIFEVLRKDAIDKCSIKFNKCRPRIKLQNLTDRDILKEKQKYFLNAGKYQPRNYNLISSGDIIENDSPVNCTTAPQPDFDHGDGNHEPLISQNGMKVELDESINMELHCDGPEFEMETESTNCQGSTTVKQEDTFSSVARQRHRQPSAKRQSYPKMGEYIERIDSNGQPSSRNKFRCKLCSKLFSGQGNTIRHIKIIHLKEKQFRCPVCSKASSTKHNLESHMRSHSGIKPYKCYLCPADFFQRHHLRRHLLAHSGERPHKCELCLQACFTGHELNTHYRKVHQGLPPHQQ